MPEPVQDVETETPAAEEALVEESLVRMAVMDSPVGAQGCARRAQS